MLIPYSGFFTIASWSMRYLCSMVTLSLTHSLSRSLSSFRWCFEKKGARAVRRQKHFLINAKDILWRHVIVHFARHAHSLALYYTLHIFSLCVSLSLLCQPLDYIDDGFFFFRAILPGSLYWIIRNRNYEFEIRYYQLLLFSFAAMLLLLLLLLFEFSYVCIFSYTLYPCCLCHYYTRFNRCRAAHVIKMFQFFFRSLACHRRRCRQWWWCCCCCLGYCLQLQHLCMIMDFCMTFHFDSFHGTSSVSIFSFFGRFFARYVLLNAPNALDTVAFFFSFLLLLSLDNAYASLWSRTDIVK